MQRTVGTVIISYDAAWEASIDYDWKWAGDPSVGYGYYYMYGYMDILDADGNGYVDFLEFIMVNNLVCARTPREKLSWAFKVFVYCD